MGYDFQQTSVVNDFLPNQTHHAPFIGGHSVFYPANEDIQSIRCNSVASSAGSLAMNDLETA